MEVEIKAGCGEGGPGESVKKREPEIEPLRSQWPERQESRVRETKKGGTTKGPDNVWSYEMKGDS